MPAAELSRLQAQISAISTQFDRPPQFLRSLLTLMELYADQHFQPGKLSQVKHLYSEHHLPTLVIQQLNTALGRLTKQYPAAALATMDSLKQERYFEAKVLATGMLGNFPVQYKSSVYERIKSWIQPDEDEQIVDEILHSVNGFFIEYDIETWFLHINKWLQSEDFRFKKIGLHALNLLVNDDRFSRFENIFPFIEPVILHPFLSLQRDILDVFKSLIKRSEMESLAFIKSILLKTKDAEVIRFIRRCVPLFSPEGQERLAKYIPEGQS
jgi:hypothetical protein